MTPPVADQLSFEDTNAVLSLVAGDPTHARERAAVIEAVRTAAALSPDGTVTANTIRPHVPSWVQPQLVGSTTGTLSRRGVLVWTGRWDTNEDRKGRNEGKPTKVYLYNEAAV